MVVREWLARRAFTLFVSRSFKAGVAGTPSQLSHLLLLLLPLEYLIRQPDVNPVVGINDFHRAAAGRALHLVHLRRVLLDERTARRIRNGKIKVSRHRVRQPIPSRLKCVMKKIFPLMFVRLIASAMFLGVSQASTQTIPPQCWWYCATFNNPCDWRVNCYCDYIGEDCLTYSYYGC